MHTRQSLPLVGFLCLGLSALFGCERDRPTPEYIEYLPSDNTHFERFTVDACYLGGPDSTTALITVDGLSDWEEIHQVCDDGRSAPAPHLDIGISQMDLVAGPDPGQVDTLVARMGHYDPDTYMFDGVQQGMEALVAIRPADGKWYLTRWVEVRTHSSAPVDPVPPEHADVDLPNKWSDLITEMQSTNADYANACPDYEPRSAEEFSDYVLTPIGTFCDEPFSPDSGTTNNSTNSHDDGYDGPPRDGGT